MTLPLNAPLDHLTLCVAQLSQQQQDRIASQALLAGMRPRDIITLLDLFARWHALGYQGFDNPAIDASVASLSQTMQAGTTNQPEATSK